MTTNIENKNNEIPIGMEIEIVSADGDTISRITTKKGKQITKKGRPPTRNLDVLERMVEQSSTSPEIRTFLTTLAGYKMDTPLVWLDSPFYKGSWETK